MLVKYRCIQNLQTWCNADFNFNGDIMLEHVLDPYRYNTIRIRLLFLLFPHCTISVQCFSNKITLLLKVVPVDPIAWNSIHPKVE